ncbi:MAG: hypothetical protein J5693_04735 [Bacteroidales bacterium]|nr:hypothetical protein [Bacteroidales bacterium]
MKKAIYESPVAETFFVRPAGVVCESERDTSVNAALNALGNSTSEETTEYGTDGTVNW